MISFATEPAFTPALPAHSFQAPTLIGCQIFKEQGTHHYEFCTAFYFPDILLSRFVSEAEQKIMHEYFPCVKQDWGNISKNRIFFENNFNLP